ncbi:MAG: thioredoxin domain-containing protein [Syntrophorhabdus sp.]|nr:thioredoxin domain-containing protein [Syntrophorhabdus sp.]
MNRLARERSAYLRHAAHQRIDWHPWSQEAFDRAAREDKPVFLSSGAIWCHWCHVMAKESFEDDTVAAILNEHYIAIKLDRDERPDVDRRYQQAVAAMGQGGGWPLSVFLTPDKKPFFGGTYFPPTERYGMPAFGTVLLAISRYYKEKRDEIEEQGGILFDAIRRERKAAGPLSLALVDEAAERMLAAFDKANGGFGSAPKFAMPGAIEFLLGRFFFSGDEGLALMLKKTLSAMAEGGFHDQIGGGFHRYSTDSGWAVPHFEKMTDDNAWLLRNYCDAFRLFGDPYLKETARGIIAFVDKELSDPRGGFYASMDADVTPDDEGGYFTWTEEDLRRTLGDEECRVLFPHLFDARNAVHHDPRKVVLSVRRTVDDIAGETGLTVMTTAEIIERGKQKLLAEREKRQRPFVDTALYTSLNGMMISAYCKAYRTFGDRTVLDRALLALERIRDVNVLDGVLYHSEGVNAFLEDYAYFCDALIAAYEATGERKYLDDAKAFMDRCIERFRDGRDAGFFDTEEEVIGVRLKGIEDIPRPSANAVAILVLLKLAAISGDDRYRDHARSALEAFSSEASPMAIHGAYYFCALEAFYRMVKLEVRAGAGSGLAEASLFAHHPCTCVTWGDPGENVIIPCIATTCFEPLTSAEALKEFLEAREPGI